MLQDLHAHTYYSFCSKDKPEAVIEAAMKDGAAAAAVRVKDTVKVADERGFIVDTPDRAMLWNVQTPQIFAKALYLDALEKARQSGLAVTDDCRLAEAAGYPVKLVEGSYTNIKITTPDDVSLAEAILSYRRTKK